MSDIQNGAVRTHFVTVFKETEIAQPGFDTIYSENVNVFRLLQFVCRLEITCVRSYVGIKKLMCMR